MPEETREAGAADASMLKPYPASWKDFPDGHVAIRRSNFFFIICKIQAGKYDNRSVVRPYLRNGAGS